MPEETTEDYYDVLQIGTNAEPETINRVYRMLAQRYHPDNQQSGNESRFRIITEAYAVLSDPEKRARYDVMHQKHRDDRWRRGAGRWHDCDLGVDPMLAKYSASYQSLGACVWICSYRGRP